MAPPAVWSAGDGLFVAVQGDSPAGITPRSARRQICCFCFWT